MKKGQIYEGIIEKVNFPNKAVVTVIDNNTVEVEAAKKKAEDASRESLDATKEKLIEEIQKSDGKEVKVQIKGGIAGQKIRFSVKKARRDKCMGRLLDIVEASPEETAKPMCPKFGTCGGCNYQSLPYEKQLELKKRQVLDLVEPVYYHEVEKQEKSLNDTKEETKDSGSDTTFVEDKGNTVSDKKPFIYDGILTSPEIYGYRNKMEFSFGDEVKDGPLTLGLHKKGSFHDIIDADCCKIVHEDFTKVLVCVRDYCRENKIPHYKKNFHEGVLRHLLVRRSSSTGEILVALVVSSQQEIDWAELTNRLKSLDLDGALTGFLLITNDGLGDVVKSDKTELLYGTDCFTEEILGLKFKISPFSFFQTNTKGAEVLYSRARQYILGDFTGENADKVLEGVELKEALSGIENNSNTEVDVTAFKDKVVFDLYSGTGTIAQIIAPVAKKVIGVEIVAEAVEAAKENAALNGLTNCEFIAGDVLKVIDEIEEKPDFIILDPPRDGIHPKALRKIIDYGVENIVYISCKPTSFARDLEVFEEYGYEMKRMSNVDMFPETVHVESVCLLSKLKSKNHINVELKMDEFDLTVAESKATYNQIKEYVLEKTGLRISNLYIAQIKQKCGIIERENYNNPKNEDVKQPKCPLEKEKAIMSALKYFRMI